MALVNIECHPAENDFVNVEGHQRPHRRSQSNPDSIVELERRIFCLIFHLIEMYYRPSSGASGTGRATASSAEHQGRAADGGWHCTYRLPVKRIYGLSKAYKTQFESAASVASAGHHRSDRQRRRLHRDAIDWQLVFATVSGYPTTKRNLAKELDYDSLFDLDDAIAQSALLLANARQHSDLIDRLVLHQRQENQTRSSTCLTNINGGYGGTGDFEKLARLVEQLIHEKKDQLMLMLAEAGNEKKSSSAQTETGWLLFSGKKPDCDAQHKASHDDLIQGDIDHVRKEIDTWEEFLDIVNIGSS